MRAHTTSAVWVRGIAGVLAAEGLDVRALLTAAAIDPAALDDPVARVSTEKISRLWELAAEQSGNPAIGLAQHLMARPASFDVVGYTMMSCANLLAAFERLIRYLLILSDALMMTLSEERGGYRVTFELFGGNRPVPRQRVEFILISVIGFCHWINGREFHPLTVELPYPIPADPAPYREAFGCGVLFEASSTSLLFADTHLTVPLPTSNPVLAELHDRFAGEYLRRFDHSQTSYRAREVIIRRLPDGEPRRDQVAGELRLSERTLQRRLEAEATSSPNCSTIRAASSPSSTSVGCTFRWRRQPTCSASQTRAAFSGLADAGSISRPGGTAASCSESRRMVPAARRPARCNRW